MQSVPILPSEAGNRALKLVPPIAFSRGIFLWAWKPGLCPMSWGQILLCGWPGLSQLWLRGRYQSLVWAVGFSIVLNLALVSTFLWPAFLGDSFPAVIWPIIFLAWMLSTWSSLSSVKTLTLPPPMSAEQERIEYPEQNVDGKKSHDNNNVWNSRHTLFNRAQREYLQGQWTSAETLLKAALEESERDIEARLLWATLLRRTRRTKEAYAELRIIEKFDEAVHWNFEIRRERLLLDSIPKENGYNDENDSDVIASNH